MIIKPENLHKKIAYFLGVAIQNEQNTYKPDYDGKINVVFYIKHTKSSFFCIKLPVCKRLEGIRFVGLYRAEKADDRKKIRHFIQ